MHTLGGLLVVKTKKITGGSGSSRVTESAGVDPVVVVKVHCVQVFMQGCPPVLQRMGFQRAGVIYRSVGVPPTK